MILSEFLVSPCQCHMPNLPKKNYRNNRPNKDLIFITLYPREKGCLHYRLQAVHRKPNNLTQSHTTSKSFVSFFWVFLFAYFPLPAVILTKALNEVSTFQEVFQDYLCRAGETPAPGQGHDGMMPGARGQWRGPGLGTTRWMHVAEASTDYHHALNMMRFAAVIQWSWP